MSVPDPAASGSNSGQQVITIYKQEKDEKGNDTWIRYCDPIVR